ncbi:MAG: glycosyltransferase [Planctomycetota bacterium]|jgi:glycosyltransferase involved in cell wall biosynthesis
MTGRPISASPPTVAVVIPCYGYAHLLPAAVASMADQTWQHVDCVIVDPESPDDTAVVAQQLIEQFKSRRIRLLKQDNRGLSASRNEAIQSTTAPLILPLDADDLLEPQALERMVQPFLHDDSISVVHCAGREFGDRNNDMPAVQVDEHTQLHKNRLPYCSMFTRRAWQQVGGYNENMRGGYEDWDFWTGMLEHGLQFHRLEEQLFRYHKHGRTMIDAALEKDIWLRSRMILNHPNMYRPEHVLLAKEVLDLDGQEPPAHLRFRIASFYTEVNCPEGGVPHCRVLLGKRGPRLEVAGMACLSFMLGYGLLATDQPAEAIAPLRRAVDLEPGRAQYLRALALALFHGGKPEEAVRTLETALCLEPDSQEGLLMAKKMRQAVS